MDSYSLNAALGIRERAVFLGKRSCGKDNVRELCRLRQEDILDTEELQVLKGCFHVVHVRIAEHRVLAHDVKAFYAAPMCGMHYFHNGKSCFFG